MNKYRVVFANGTQLVIEADTWRGTPVHNNKYMKATFDLFNHISGGDQSIAELYQVVGVIKEEQVQITN